ncbi:AAA domain protein [Brucella pseudogrignonensis]|uniref:AAA domain protein n=1 Tax=Brucella pseudogrignonensis TaxID=419475 RepID=A0A256G6N1_9HYPH|nr:AAA domain protein [Brucella pseudogrignonensis]
MGENGAGKSSVLFNIAHLFDRAFEIIMNKHSRRKSQKNQQQKFSSIKYIIDSKEIILSVEGNNVSMMLDRRLIQPSLSFMPRKVLAFAHLPTDRYPFKIQTDDSRYVYLGLRQTTNMMSTSALVSKIMKSIWIASRDTLRADMISDTLQTVGLDRSVTASFKIRDKELLSINDFEGFRSRLQFTLRNVNSIDSDIFSAKNDDIIFQAFSFIEGAGASSVQRLSKSNDDFIKFELLDRKFSNDILGMEFLRDIKVITNPEILFKKKSDGNEVKFSDLSSGDQQILGTNLRLVSEIEPRSLILIDEPEVSLHPKRQQEYVPGLYRNVPFIDSCTVVMATHSNLLVSNLPKNSSVISMRPSIGARKQFLAMELDPHGLPSEQVLYSVFGIDAATSYYALKDVQRIIEISQSQRTESKLNTRQLEEVLEIKLRLQKSAAARAPVVLEVMPLIAEILNNA